MSFVYARPAVRGRPTPARTALMAGPRSEPGRRGVTAASAIRNCPRSRAGQRTVPEQAPDQSAREASRDTPPPRPRRRTAGASLAAPAFGAAAPPLDKPDPEGAPSQSATRIHNCIGPGPLDRSASAGSARGRRERAGPRCALRRRYGAPRLARTRCRLEENGQEAEIATSPWEGLRCRRTTSPRLSRLWMTADAERRPSISYAWPQAVRPRGHRRAGSRAAEIRPSRPRRRSPASPAESVGDPAAPGRRNPGGSPPRVCARNACSSTGPPRRTPQGPALRSASGRYDRSVLKNRVMWSGSQPAGSPTSVCNIESSTQGDTTLM